MQFATDTLYYNSARSAVTLLVFIIVFVVFGTAFDNATRWAWTDTVKCTQFASDSFGGLGGGDMGGFTGRPGVVDSGGAAEVVGGG